MLEDYSTPHGKRYFVNLSWVIPCCEQKLGIGAQAMCIACNDTSVIVINFRKSKTHAITDTYCSPVSHGVCLNFLLASRDNFFCSLTELAWCELPGSVVSGTAL